MQINPFNTIQRTLVNLFVVLIEIVPHGCHHPGNFSETCVRILVLDGDLGITEEEAVAGNGSEIIMEIIW